MQSQNNRGPLFTRMWRRSTAILLIMALPFNAMASFGTMQVHGPVQITSMFTGSAGSVFITFSMVLPGCGTVAGGYLTPTWPAANSGVSDEPRASRMISNILFARAMEKNVEIRYRVNSAGSGWDNCAVDAVWVL